MSLWNHIQLSKALVTWSMIRSIVLVLLLFLNTFQCATIPMKAEPALLVVSYDAFRPEYLNRSVTPNLNKFAEKGVSASFMKNIFPTKTFPNHFTIATVSANVWTFGHLAKFYQRDDFKCFQFLCRVCTQNNMALLATKYLILCRASWNILMTCFITTTIHCQFG